MRKIAAIAGILVIGGMVGAIARESSARFQQPAAPSRTPRDVLASSTDRAALEAAAISLVRTGDRQDLAVLGRFLRDPEFLARLDDFTNLKTLHLTRVMTAMAEHPNAQVAELCLSLANDPAYSTEDDRLRLLLKVLAAVKPMGERAVALFQRTNEEGYFVFNASLLTANGSPRALSLFEAMMVDRSVPIEDRVDSVHMTLVPGRTQMPILRAAERILSRSKEEPLSNGIIESIFDFQMKWFGTDSRISAPRWQTASADTLRFALRMADAALARRDLTPELREKVARSRVAILQAIPAAQK